MAVGRSNKVVIELDPQMKIEIYKSLKSRGLNLKEWFIEQAKIDLLNDDEVEK